MKRNIIISIIGLIVGVIIISLFGYIGINIPIEDIDLTCTDGGCEYNNTSFILNTTWNFTQADNFCYSINYNGSSHLVRSNDIVACKYYEYNVTKIDWIVFKDLSDGD